MEQLEALERECGLSPGGPLPLWKGKQTKQGERQHFHAGVLAWLAVLNAHSFPPVQDVRGGGAPEVGSSGTLAPVHRSRQRVEMAAVSAGPGMLSDAP